MKAVMDLCAQSVISCKNSLMSLFKCINLVVPQCICLLNYIKRLGNILTNLCSATLYNLINKSLQDCMSLSVSLSVSLAVSLSLSLHCCIEGQALHRLLWTAALFLHWQVISQRGGERELCSALFSHRRDLSLSHTYVRTYISGITPTNSMPLWEICRIG